MIIKSKEDTDMMITEPISNSIVMNKSQKKDRGGSEN